METHHFSSQIHDLESCPLREENRQLKLELEAIKDLAQKTEGERQQHCADLMAADERIEELEARIKELELALSNSREHEKALRKCFDNHRQRIKELEAAISKMETAAPNQIDLKAENERLKKENKNLKEQLKKDGEWLCNGNEQNKGIDDNQSWGIFG